jgi:hypothetical protein
LKTFFRVINEVNDYLEKEGGAIISDILIIIINSYPSLNIKWLLTGEGNMLEISEDHMLKVSCDEVNCLKNYAIKLQKDKIRQLENLDSNDSTIPNFYNLN